MTTYMSDTGAPITVTISLDDLSMLLRKVERLVSDNSELESRLYSARSTSRNLEEQLSAYNQDHRAEIEHMQRNCSEHIRTRQEFFDSNERLKAEINEYRYAPGEYIVVMESYGENKIRCINVVRDYICDPEQANAPLGLKEAKELVESSPVALTEGLNFTSAVKLVRELRKHGATVQLYCKQDRTLEIKLDEEVKNDAQV